MNERKWRTAGGEVVTWTYNPTDRFGGRAIWGSLQCSGCRERQPRVQVSYAQDHAATCREIP